MDLLPRTASREGAGCVGAIGWHGGTEAATSDLGLWQTPSPSALLGPEMVNFALNFCDCAVDQDKGRCYIEFLAHLPFWGGLEP